MTDTELLDGGDKVFIFIATDAFSDEKHVLLVNMNTMKVSPPVEVGKGTYRTNGGVYYKVDEDMNVVDDSDAWQRGFAL